MSRGTDFRWRHCPDPAPESGFTGPCPTFNHGSSGSRQVGTSGTEKREEQWTEKKITTIGGGVLLQTIRHLFNFFNLVQNFVEILSEKISLASLTRCSRGYRGIHSERSNQHTTEKQHSPISADLLLFLQRQDERITFLDRNRCNLLPKPRSWATFPENLRTRFGIQLTTSPDTNPTDYHHVDSFIHTDANSSGQFPTYHVVGGSPNKHATPSRDASFCSWLQVK